MIFFTGIHDPHLAARVPAACISAHRLARRRSGFPPPRHGWIIDSGAFQTLALHGGYPDPPDTYAALIRRYAKVGRVLCAVAQDYMCEPFMLEQTGLTVADHQRMTIERYDALVTLDCARVPIMPVLQGYDARDYVDHVRQYGGRLRYREWVGVGSVCKRNAHPSAVEAVLLAIKRERPDLRLHGFGVKVTALGQQRWEGSGVPAGTERLLIQLSQTNE